MKEQYKLKMEIDHETGESTSPNGSRGAGHLYAAVPSLGVYLMSAEDCGPGSLKSSQSLCQPPLRAGVVGDLPIDEGKLARHNDIHFIEKLAEWSELIVGSGPTVVSFDEQTDEAVQRS